MNCVVYGLGYVGLTLSVVLAESGFKVFGIEKDKRKISSLKKGEMYLHEPNLKLRFNKLYNSKKIILKNPMIDCKYHVICVGTPISKKNKKPILDSMNQILNDLAKFLKKGDCIILRSTVPIGFTRDFIIFNLFKKFNLIAGSDYHICFAPERTIEGNALYELTSNPQIISGYSKKCLDLAINFFNSFCSTIIKLPNLESAEMSKLVDNTFRDVIFSFANEISEIADHHKIDVIKIINACNYFYQRNNIPKPSPGVGGPCLSKDPYILANSVKGKNSLDLKIIPSAREVNLQIINKLYLKISRKLKKFKTANILFCGLAFKGHPETNDLRDSTSLVLLNKFLNNKKNNIWVYDPVISKKSIMKLGYDYIDPFKNKKKYDLIILSNNHPIYKSIDFNFYIKANMNLIICDTWKLLDESYFGDKVEHFGVGF